jgi:hypothetical protein
LNGWQVLHLPAVSLFGGFMIVKIGNTEAEVRVEAVLSMPRLSFTANTFTWVQALVALALTFQCDALAPLQTKREDGRPMLTLKGNLANPPQGGNTNVPREWFAEPVQEVDTAHFGLTLLSTAALKRCKKPWFWSKPDPTGSWGDGRRDPDIFFWENWRESGNRIYVTPRVTIGHGEYVVTWPGRNLGEPVFQWTSDWTKEHKRPESAWSAPQ